MPNQLRRFMNWRGWFLGLYLACIPTAVGKLVDFLASNGLEASGFDVAKGAGLSMKQISITFVVSIALNALLYVKSKPLPDEIEQPVTPPPSA